MSKGHSLVTRKHTNLIACHFYIQCWGPLPFHCNVVSKNNIFYGSVCWAFASLASSDKPHRLCTGITPCVFIIRDKHYSKRVAYLTGIHVNGLFQNFWAIDWRSTIATRRRETLQSEIWRNGSGKKFRSCAEHSISVVGDAPPVITHAIVEYFWVWQGVIKRYVYVSVPVFIRHTEFNQVSLPPLKC